MSKEQVESMKLAVTTDADVEMMEKIFEGDYIAAFDVPVDKLSENTKFALSYYAMYSAALSKAVSQSTSISSPFSSTTEVSSIFPICTTFS